MLSLVFAIQKAQGLPVTQSDQQPYDDPSDEYKQHMSAVGIILLMTISCTFSLVVFCGLVFWIVRNRLRLSEDQLLREEENQAYLELNSEEQELYFQSKEYFATNPYLRGELQLSQKLSIQEKGIKAWEFVKDQMLTNNDLLIVNKTELNFFKKFECSTQANLPIPNKNEVYYFESKVYSLLDPENTMLSIGLAVKPYPWFRLPGRHHHSVSYDSDGYRRHNQPFQFNYEAPFPKLLEGDVVGVGYRVRLGTVFFTRNGKKVSELKIGGHIKNFKIPEGGQLYPTIGANNLCSIHVNLGQMGFVFIEGNVKKWGFAPLEGNGPAPPAYNKFNSDVLLERSEIESENDFSERENDFPPDFWAVHSVEDPVDKEESQDKYSYNAYSEVNSMDERITLDSLHIPQGPPSYQGDNEQEAGTSGTGRSEAVNRDSMAMASNAPSETEGSLTRNETVEEEVAPELERNPQLEPELDGLDASTHSSPHIPEVIDDPAVSNTDNDDPHEVPLQGQEDHGEIYCDQNVEMEPDAGPSTPGSSDLQ